MFRTILYLIALIVVFYLAFRKRKPVESLGKDATLDPDAPEAFIIHGGHRESTQEPSKPKMHIVDRTLDPNSPRAFIICSPWNGKSRESTSPHSPKPPQKEG